MFAFNLFLLLLCVELNARLRILLVCHRNSLEAEKRLQQLDLDSGSATRSARKAAAKLHGKEQEVGLLELHELANDRLQAWLSWVSSRNSLAEADGQASVSYSVVADWQDSFAWSKNKLCFDKDISGFSTSQSTHESFLFPPI